MAALRWLFNNIEPLVTLCFVLITEDMAISPLLTQAQQTCCWLNFTILQYPENFNVNHLNYQSLKSTIF